MCCEKKTLIGWRSVWNMRWRAAVQEVESSTADRLQAGCPCIQTYAQTDTRRSHWCTPPDTELWRMLTSTICCIIIADCSSYAPFHCQWPAVSSCGCWYLERFLTMSSGRVHCTSLQSMSQDLASPHCSCHNCELPDCDSLLCCIAFACWQLELNKRSD